MLSTSQLFCCISLLTVPLRLLCVLYQFGGTAPRSWLRVDSLKLAIVGIFIPQKLAHPTNRGLLSFYFSRLTKGMDKNASHVD